MSEESTRPDDSSHLEEGSFTFLHGKYRLATRLLFIIILYVGFVVCYALSNILWPFLVPRLILGFIVLLVLPGQFFLRLNDDRYLEKLSGAVTIGLSMIVIEGHLLLGIQLQTSMNIPFDLWTTLCSLVVAVLGVILNADRNWVLIPSNRSNVLGKNLLYIIGIAIVLRFILLAVSHGSIAPDACLYSDYARNIILGNHQSNVLNDRAVIDFGNRVEMLRHHGIVYVFSLSWILIPASLSGPTFILLIIGTNLILLAHTTVKKVFGESAATWIAFILAIQPVFVFHSAIAYGPEISSLLLIGQGTYFLLTSDNKYMTSLAGILIATGCLVWYPNFLAVMLILPILTHGLGLTKLRETLTLLLVTLTLLAARLVFYDVWLFAILGMIVLMGVYSMMRITRVEVLPGLLGFSVTVLSVLIVGYWPLQLYPYISSAQTSQAGILQLIKTTLAPIEPIKIAAFLLFTIFHLGFAFPILLWYGVRKTATRKEIFVLFLSGLICGAGTLKVFGLIEGSLQIIYIFSDSRFFLSMAFLTALALGGSFVNTHGPLFRTTTLKTGRNNVRLKALVIVVGFIPAFIGIPSGIILIDIETRYGWIGLQEMTMEIGDDETTFLVDRAREFSWLTGRKAVVLNLEQPGLASVIAIHQMLSLMNNFSLEYLIIDDYTINHWRTTGYLYYDQLSIGNTAPFATIPEFEAINDDGAHDLTSLAMKQETQPNEIGRNARIFQIVNLSYSTQWNSTFLGSAWTAASGGSLSNDSGYARLTIGNQQDFVYTTRSGGFDLDVSVEGGFLLFDIDDSSANTREVQIWDSDGMLLGNADQINSTHYVFMMGNVTLGDIRIVAEGNSGEWIVIHSVCLWQPL